MVHASKQYIGKAALTFFLNALAALLLMVVAGSIALGNIGAVVILAIAGLWLAVWQILKLARLEATAAQLTPEVMKQLAALQEFAELAAANEAEVVDQWS